MKRSEESYEGDRDQVYSDAGRGERMQDVLERRWSRRSVLMGVALGAAGTPLVSGLALAQEATPQASPTAGGSVGVLGFEPISLDMGETYVVAAGHSATAFLKWGDPLFADAPVFDLAAQSAESQARQFGYNCDWIGFFPLPQGSTTSDHGLLVVNHEYTNPEMMFPGYLTPNPEFGTIEDADEFLINTSQAIVDTELAAHGLSVVEIQRSADGAWDVVLDSAFNRRITATTPTETSGPAAGHHWLITTDDPTGTQVLGTLNNCAGGSTPWGTALTGEENFQQYFANLDALAEDDPVAIAHARYGLPGGSSGRLWETVYPRFDLAQEPNEPFRYGWIVEFDPYDAQSVPKKRTALGRNKHEGATSAVSPGGQVAFYSGDDERFDYAYKFVTAGAFNPNDRAANANLLDEGTLYAARFNDDGTGEWIPLVLGEGELTEANGFASQAQILINTRAAGDAVGATKMDRPEDFETNPVTGKVYLVCTNNSNRTLEQIDTANPRPQNYMGHIIEITEDGGDHAATAFTWEIFILAGDPASGGTWYGGIDAELISPFAAPDNLTFDNSGNIWISTDGMPANLPGNDGLFVAPTEGEERGRSMQFFSSVPGAECSGPTFNPDNSALFVSVQHPGEGGTVDAPITLWPTGEVAPRPSVVVITADTANAKISRRV